MKEETIVSITKTFFSWENAYAFVNESNEAYPVGEWESLEKEVRTIKDTNIWEQSVLGYRVALIYRKRQTELDV